MQTAHTAKTPAAVAAADDTVQERLFLIGKATTEIHHKLEDDERAAIAEKS